MKYFYTAQFFRDNKSDHLRYIPINFNEYTISRSLLPLLSNDTFSLFPSHLLPYLGEGMKLNTADLTVN